MTRHRSAGSLKYVACTKCGKKFYTKPQDPKDLCQKCRAKERRKK